MANNITKAVETIPTDWKDPQTPLHFAEPGYSDKLYFHRFEHALATRQQVRELGKWCVYNGQDVDFHVLDWAALGHDYGFYDYPTLDEAIRQQYPTRETYAAAQTRQAMQAAGAPETAINQVEQAIWSTDFKVTCTTKEGRILRQADLMNVGTPNNIRDFLLNTVKLFQEQLLFAGGTPTRLQLSDFLAFCKQSYKVLSLYNDEDVSLGEFDRAPSGKSFFFEAARDNIKSLQPEIVKKVIARIGDLPFINRADA